MKKLINTIIQGDCIEEMKKIPDNTFDLIFADPPFNIGYKYDKYHDKIERNNYIAWTKDWMTACKKVLKPAGSFYIAIGDDYAANVKVVADELGLVMRNWIIWHYTFGQQTKDKFARSHTHIFLCSSIFSIRRRFLSPAALNTFKSSLIYSSPKRYIAN